MGRCRSSVSEALRAWLHFGQYRVPLKACALNSLGVIEVGFFWTVVSGERLLSARVMQQPSYANILLVWRSCRGHLSDGGVIVRESVWFARTCLLLEAVLAGQMTVYSASSLARLLIWLMG
jgi:hypothetical protein